MKIKNFKANSITEKIHERTSWKNDFGLLIEFNITDILTHYYFLSPNFSFSGNVRTQKEYKKYNESNITIDELKEFEWHKTEK